MKDELLAVLFNLLISAVAETHKNKLNDLYANDQTVKSTIDNFVDFAVGFVGDANAATQPQEPTPAEPTEQDTNTAPPVVETPEPVPTPEPTQEEQQSEVGESVSSVDQQNLLGNTLDSAPIAQNAPIQDVPAVTEPSATTEELQPTP